MFDIKKIKFRPLIVKDGQQIKDLDNENPIGEIFDFVKNIIEDANNYGCDQDYVYGAFDDSGNLLAYCTLGGADEINQAMYGDKLLSDVYVRNNYKGLGIGKEFMRYILSIRCDDCIWLVLWNDDLESFYANLGFSLVDKNSGLMVYNHFAQSLNFFSQT